MAVRILVFLAIFLFVGPTTDGKEAQPAVPAVMLFGDSLGGVGNNDYIATLVKANKAPYGRDFKDQVATGRFGNGKLLSDIIGWSKPYSILFVQMDLFDILHEFLPVLWHAYLVLQLAWYTAGEKLGFNGSPPAYLSPQASGQNLLIGANFASAGSGYYDPTARIYVSTIHRWLIIAL